MILSTHYSIRSALSFATKLLVMCLVIGSLFVTAVLPISAEEESPPPDDSGLNIFDGPDSEVFKRLNPLAIAESTYEEQFSSPAGILNRALLFIFPISGLILFVMLVWGGFEIVANAHNKKGLEKGRERITWSLVGMMLLFGSFWIMQIVQFVFGLAVL